MMTWTEATVAAALGIETRAAEDIVYDEIGTDTRALSPRSLFVALRGESHDAHDFLEQARAGGAIGAVVERIPDGAPTSLRYHVVPDTLVALGLLGRFHRRRLNMPVCAVAGSNGKTTTKDMLRVALSPRYDVHATPGNLNNLIGVPLTLLGATDDTDVVVAEVGTNVPGEVARLAAIVEPDIAVITTVAAEHLEGLGDLDGVLREETSLLPWLPPAAIVAVPDEPAMLAERARTMVETVVVVGFSDRADENFRASNLALDDEGRASFDWRSRRVSLQLRGRHNARNALLALAIAEAWGVDTNAAVAALATLPAAKMRAEFKHYGDMTVIADCYNANPGSVEAAVDLLAGLPRRGGRVAVFGTMRELGQGSAAIHRESAESIARRDLDRIVATGEFAAAFAPLAETLGDRLIIDDDPFVAFDRLSPMLRGDEVVLLKASRGVALERLLPRFEEKWGPLHPHGEAFGPRASSRGTGERGDAPPAERPQTQTPALDGNEGPASGTMGG